MTDEISIPDDLRVRYLQRRQQDLESLKTAHARRSFEEFKRIGHQLRGNAASYGYSDLEKIATGIEEAGVAGDLFEAGRQLNQFQDWCLKRNLVR